VTEERWIVRLPRAAEPPYRVFVNGVPQVEGVDYELRPGALAFMKSLETEGRLGFWRWTLMFFAIAGTYRRHDSVDVQYTVGGKRQVATGLAITAPESAGSER